MKQVYSEILTADNILTITDNENGTITINPNQEFLIQDVKINTSNITNRTFTINPSTTYHLRFSLNGSPINNYTPQQLSFYLVDINDTNYNPNSVAETDTQFDTKYDDILVAKIISDANGSISITSFKNKRLLQLNIFRSEGVQVLENRGSSEGYHAVIDVSLNWSRTPITKGLTLEGTTKDNTTLQGLSINEPVIKTRERFIISLFDHTNDQVGSWSNWLNTSANFVVNGVTFTPYWEKRPAISLHLEA